MHFVLYNRVIIENIFFFQKYNSAVLYLKAVFFISIVTKKTAPVHKYNYINFRIPTAL